MARQTAIPINTARPVRRIPTPRILAAIHLTPRPYAKRLWGPRRGSPPGVGSGPMPGRHSHRHGSRAMPLPHKAIPPTPIPTRTATHRAGGKHRVGPGEPHLATPTRRRPLQHRKEGRRSLGQQAITAALSLTRALLRTAAGRGTGAVGVATQATLRTRPYPHTLRTIPATRPATPAVQRSSRHRATLYLRARLPLHQPLHGTHILAPLPLRPHRQLLRQARRQRLGQRQAQRRGHRRGRGHRREQVTRRGRARRSCSTACS